MNSPTLNPFVPFGITALTDLAVGGLIRNSNPTVEAARAATVVVVGNAFIQAGQGDPQDATTAIEAAISAAVAAKTADPAIAAFAQALLAGVNMKATAIQEFLSGTAAGALGALVLTQVGQAAVALATKYLPAQAK